MTAGRPTKYELQFCETVIELGKQGKSRVQIACFLDVDPKTLRDWAETHEEFSLALSRAKAEEQNWWETEAQLNLKSREFNAAVWKKSVEARFRDDYTEKKEFEHSGGLNLLFDPDDKNA